MARVNQHTDNKNNLAFFLPGDEDMDLTYLALLTELDAKGQTTVVHRNPTIGHGIISSNAYEVDLAEWKADFIRRGYPQRAGYIDHLLERHDEILAKKKSEVKGGESSEVELSFRIEEREGKQWLVFPAVRQSIKGIDGVFASQKSKEWQKKLERINPDICAYTPSAALDVTCSKINSVPYLEEAGKQAGFEVAPPTISLPLQRGSVSPEDIAKRMKEKGIVYPCVVKADHGSGGEAVCMSSEPIGQVC